MLNEVEAAQALGELRRERTAAGLLGLNEGQAALFLRSLGEVRSLPETTPTRWSTTERRSTTGRRSIPLPRRRSRLGRRLFEPSEPVTG